MKSKASLLIVFAVFIGVIVGLVIASNFDWTDRTIAADSETAKPILLGAQDDMVDQSQVSSAQSLSNAFAHVANVVRGSVVTIKSTKMVRTEVPEFWQHFFNVPEEQRRQGLGSGVIVNADGYIITNNHVVENADELQVSINKVTYDAEIVGRDPESDLAVIKIDPNGNALNAINLGDSDELQVGEWVLAIGNPFAEVLDQTVTAGIVSAKGRTGLANQQDITFQDFIQTDAAINPGNSGGALVNMSGELVGINTMIVSSSGGNVGLGFAIPINLAKNVMEQLIDSGKVMRGWIGVGIRPVDQDMAQALGLDEAYGAMVERVYEDSPAEDAEIEAGDVILEIDGRRVNDDGALVSMIGNYPPNAKVDVLIWRNGKEKKYTITLGERPTEGVVSTPRQSADNPFGIRVAELTPESMSRFQMNYEGEEGVLVVGVEEGSTAARKNVQPGDLIKSINRQKVTSVSEFNEVIENLDSDRPALFRIKHDRSTYFTAIPFPKDKDKDNE
jgi:serine protease Do